MTFGLITQSYYMLFTPNMHQNILIHADEDDLVDINSCDSHMTKLLLSEGPSQGCRKRDGWDGYGRPSFSLLSASAHARIISLAVALKYVVSG